MATFVQGAAFARRGDESLSRLFEPDAGVDREVALIKLALQVCARIARRLG